MSKLDRSIFVVALLLTSGLMLYVASSIYGQYHRAAAKAVVLSVRGDLLIGPHPSYRGKDGAGFTLVEFADYQCPACIAMHPKVVELLQRHSDKINLVFHHYPLSMHPQARPAALAAEASRLQGRFWPMHDALMSAGGHLSSSDLRVYAERLKLDPMRFEHDRDHAALDALDKDIHLGDTLKINATPTFLLLRSDGKVVQLGALSQVEEYLKDM